MGATLSQWRHPDISGNRHMNVVQSGGDKLANVIHTCTNMKAQLNQLTKQATKKLGFNVVS